VAALDYIHVTHGEPHAQRAREILAAHPELRELAGPQPTTALWILSLVVVQLGLAVLIGDRPWYIWIPVAYLAGATIDHALWALIHDTCHNLVFRWRNGNRWIAILANLPLVVPGAISFGKYHLLHHRHMGDIEFDAGMPGPTEARVIGRSSLAKTAWMTGMIVVQGIVRPSRMNKITLLDGWTLVNAAIQIAAMALLVYVAGWAPLKYLTFGTVFAIGLHPLGARWIQEHFALAPDQETYSYYGPLNKVCFNVGYHNEHHDIVNVAWSRLPEIRRVAPEFYDSLQSYSSWSTLLVRFIRDRNITLYNAIVRPGRGRSDA
jgi:sphingolipid 4-desaturase/C4-monooxygenase